MIADNKYVTVHYVGSFEDGQVFDTSINRTPFEFLTGAKQVVPGFESAVREMEVNEEKEVILTPELAYGNYDETRKRKFPIEEVRKVFEPKVGMSIGIQTPTGAQIPAVITDVTSNEVEIDANHPFAGKTLKFKLILLEINDEPKHAGENCADCSCEEGDSCSATN